MRDVRSDLHIHSCLSPCGSLEMSPRSIARRAIERGLDLIALTAHNSALNAPACSAACQSAGIACIFGLEGTTREEAHVLCLFESPEEALGFGEDIYSLIPDIPNDPEKMGDQVFVDDGENILGEVEKYLPQAADLSIDDLALRVGEAEGLFIPAHVDKPVFSIVSQLGFLPPLPYTALETTRMPCPVNTGKLPLIMNSDAHYLDDIGRRLSVLSVYELSFQGIREAIEAGRIAYEGR